MSRFGRFAVADWSGAKGNAHPGIALAVCESGNEAPTLVSPPGRFWSREEIIDWVFAQVDDILIGFDFSFAPPLIERGSYLPGDEVPGDAKAFWAYVDGVCNDDDLCAASFLEKHHRNHFYFGKADGVKAKFMHLRRCEARYNAQGGGKPSTVYDVIGASQVAKASFAGMRTLHRLADRIPVWPFDADPGRGPLIIEIYAQIAARAAGLRKGLSKIRESAGLDTALAAFGSRPHTPLARYTDHATDAILTAAWLRHVAGREELWLPAGLTPQVARTEGWTFGVL